MPISGLVITIERGEGMEARVVGALEADGRFVIGPRGENGGEGRVPVVLETVNELENREAWAWVNGLEGVMHVDVAYVHLEELGGKEGDRGDGRGGSLEHQPVLNGDAAC